MGCIGKSTRPFQAKPDPELFAFEECGNETEPLVMEVKHGPNGLSRPRGASEIERGVFKRFRGSAEDSHDALFERYLDLEFMGNPPHRKSHWKAPLIVTALLLTLCFLMFLGVYLL
jgi:hypothetical protein